ncbi:hypothetical protein [Phytomonospora endophytica]|uniref:Uncharacterized protein n=1 Tax=Phytomonospora endophytica TaxID=714109 RepID=A0A841FWI4_9ACTN|nr:hypothetical protein [Phytomonospora endophytica]MBB6037697.1 hypothetical protein [Phytomonospora endophytica]GIG67775.1 hypothetical protein Pen01_40700 [Phytomonospora endophytica]
MTVTEPPGADPGNIAELELYAEILSTILIQLPTTSGVLTTVHRMLREGAAAGVISLSGDADTPDIERSAGLALVERIRALTRKESASIGFRIFPAGPTSGPAVP